MIVALVLGAAVRPDGTPSPTLDLRLRHAVDLWRKGRVQMICTTGGPGRHGPPEGAVARDLALSLGVPAAVVLAEMRSTNTVQNLAFARALIPARASVILVSNRWHLPRALAAARLLGLSATASGPVGRQTPGAAAAAILRETAATPLSLWRAFRWARRSGP